MNNEIKKNKLYVPLLIWIYGELFFSIMVIDGKNSVFHTPLLTDGYSVIWEGKTAIINGLIILLISFIMFLYYIISSWNLFLLNGIKNKDKYDIVIKWILCYIFVLFCTMFINDIMNFYLRVVVMGIIVYVVTITIRYTYKYNKSKFK